MVMQIWSVSSFDKLEKVVLFNFNFEILHGNWPWDLLDRSLAVNQSTVPVLCNKSNKSQTQEKHCCITKCYNRLFWGIYTLYITLHYNKIKTSFPPSLSYINYIPGEQEVNWDILMHFSCYFWPLNNNCQNPHTNISVMQQRFSLEN